MPHPLIEFKDVHKRFGQLVVLEGIDLRIDPAESVVIIGASGSGKSVMLKHIVGLLRPEKGEVYFDGQRVDTMSEHELMAIRRRCGFLFQMGALFDSLTVGDNVAFPIIEHTHKSAEEVARIVAHRLAMIGLPGIEKKMPAELSGGQRKRVALARAIALEPEIVLFDEPTTGLDPVTTAVIDEVILDLLDRLPSTAITITHDMISAFRIADRIGMLHDGKIIALAAPEEFRRLDDPRVRQFIDGRSAGPLTASDPQP